MTRRAVLTGLALAVAGCAGIPDVQGMPQAGDASDDDAAPMQPGPRARLRPTSAAGTPEKRLPDRRTVVARFAGARPTAWGLGVPGMVTVLGAAAVADRAVALTFDACGGLRPESAGCGFDAALIATLRRYDARATLFLNSRWIAANRKAFEDLAGDSRFEIANHGTRHMPLSITGRSANGEVGTRDAGEVYDEVAGNHENLTRLLGRPPRWFRSGTAHADDMAVKIVTDLGERFASFSRNGDGGATFTRDQVHHEVGRAQPGDIIISHMNRPSRATAAGYALALPDLLRRGLRTATLGEYLAPVQS